MKYNGHTTNSITRIGIGSFYSLYNNNKLQKLNSTLLSKNTKLKLELSKSLEDSEEIFSIDPGDKARRDMKLRQLGIN